MHTKGPWVAKHTPHSSNQDWVVLDGGPTHCKRVCAVYSDAPEADARLIAAAPDLLASLQGIAPMFDNDSPLLCAYVDEIKDCLAAIAKATN